MPDGLIVMKYDDRSGIDIKTKYPEEKVNIANRTLMHIFNLHEFSKEPGLASLSIDNINFVTFYSGSKTDYFFILLLTLLENPEDYEVILEEVAQVILRNIETGEYVEMLPSLFKRILDYQKNENKF